jgi:hypothetical protein
VRGHVRIRRHTVTDDLQPVAITITERRADPLSSKERRVADEGMGVDPLRRRIDRLESID